MSTTLLETRRGTQWGYVTLTVDDDGRATTGESFAPSDGRSLNPILSTAVGHAAEIARELGHTGSVRYYANLGWALESR